MPTEIGGNINQMAQIITKQIKMEKTHFNELWDTIIEDQIATPDECTLVCKINGGKDSSLESILWVRTGYRDLDQYREFNN